MDRQGHKPPKLLVQVSSDTTQPAREEQWRARFKKSLPLLFEWFRSRGAKATDAKVAQMQAEAAKLHAEAAEAEARARSVDATTQEKRNQVLFGALEGFDRILQSADPTEIKLLKLQALIDLNPELQTAFEKTRESLEVLIRQGAVIRVGVDEVDEERIRKLPPHG